MTVIQLFTPVQTLLLFVLFPFIRIAPRSEYQESSDRALMVSSSSSGCEAGGRRWWSGVFLGDSQTQT